MKKLYIIVLILFLSFLTACQKNIFLKGNDNITIELGSEYVDEGLDIPSNYTYKEENNININKVGSYYYKYNVYDKNNKLVQEILRVVNVKDTISPRFLERYDKIFVIFNKVMSITAWLNIDCRNRFIPNGT